LKEDVAAPLFQTLSMTTPQRQSKTKAKQKQSTAFV
jgi:hypothetical protein